jgi:VCBS repeat-containing protein
MHSSGTFVDLTQTVRSTASPDSDAAFLVIPDAHLLFNAEFKRTGSDLTLVGPDGQRFVVPDYFKTDRLPTLLSPEGAALGGDIVALLAGHRAPGQYAQATPPTGAAQAIGRVESLTGSATAVRNGVSIALNVGDAVYKNDVIQTGSNSAIGISFLDASAFNLSANGRMVLNEFIYDPNGTGNNTLLNLVQGAASFISGQVAKSGEMNVQTPTATMGIRGTAWTIEIVSTDGTSHLSVLTYDNQTHSITIRAGGPTGPVIGVATNQGGVWTIQPSGPLQAIATETAKSPQQVQQELAIVSAVINTQSLGQAIYVGPPITLPTPPQRTDQQQQQQQQGDQPQQTPPPNPNPQNTSTAGSSGTPVTSNTAAPTEPAPTQNNAPAETPPAPTTTTEPPPVIQIILPPEPPQPPPEPPPPPNFAPAFLTGPTIIGVPVPAGDAAVHAIAPDMDATGRWIVFVSADALPDGNDDWHGQVYLFDRLNPDAAPIRLTTQALIDGAWQELNQAAPAGETYGDIVSISLDGRFVVFAGERTVDEDGDGGNPPHPDSTVYIYDRDTGQVHVLRDHAGNAHVSGGGDYVVMEGDGGNGGFLDVVLTDTNGVRKGVIWADDAVQSPEINATGRFITFETAGTVIDINYNGPQSINHFDVSQITDGTIVQVYLYDRLEHTLVMVSSTGGFAGNGNSGALDGPGGDSDWESTLSADGNFVAFASDASNLIGSDGNDKTDVFVFDRDAQQITRVSVASDGTEANGASFRPVISPDGRYVVFASDASNLVAGDDNGVTDTFVYDLQTFTIQRVSQQPNSSGGNDTSAWGDAISGGAVFVAFGSEATNLADNDLDGFVDGDTNLDGVVDANDNNVPDTADIMVADLSGGARGIVLEQGAGPLLTTSGKLAFTDLDHNTVAVAPLGANWGTLTAQVMTDTSDSNTAGIVTWNYQLDPETARQLGFGERHVDTFAVTLTDTAGNTAVKQVSVTVVGSNEAPAVAAAILDQATPEGAAWNFAVPDGTFSDIDGDALSFSATLADGSALPAWLAFDPDTQTFSGTPPQGSEGAIELKVTASDGLRSASDNFILNIAAPAEPPNITASTPDHLIEAAGTDAGTNAAQSTLTRGGANGATIYDLTALGADGWTGIGNNNFVKTGLFGTASLNTASDTLSYILDNAKADSLTATDNVTDTFNVPVTNGVDTANTDVAFTIEGRNDAPRFATMAEFGFENGLAGWTALGQASAVNGILEATNPDLPIDPTEGLFAGLLTTEGTASASEIETFLGIAQGTLAQLNTAPLGNNNPTAGSAIATEIFLEANQVLSFDWRFATTDYNPYRDFAFFTVAPSTATKLADVFVIGDFGASGWSTGSFVAPAAGLYQVGFGVMDAGDSGVDSFLLIDNLNAGSGQTLAVTEDASAAATETADQVVNFSDPEIGDGHALGAPVFVSSDSGLGQLGALLASLAADTLNGQGGAIELSYSIDNALIQFLAAGQEIHEQYELTLDDGHGGVSTLPVAVVITGSNDAPTIATPPGTPVTDEDQPVLIAGLSVDDIDGDDLTVTLAATSTLTLAATDGLTFSDGDGTDDQSMTFSGAIAAVNAALANITYTPTDDFFGDGNIAIDVFDGTATSSADIAVTVNAVNDAPAAVADSITVAEGGTATALDSAAASVLANDTDAEGNPLTAILVNGPAHASSFALNPDGTFSYTHDGSETTSDGFSYKVNDGAADGNTVTVSIAVNPVNDAPILTGDLAAAVAEGGSTLIDAADLNFIDPDDGASEVTFTVSNQINGTVLVNGSAATSFSGQDLADGLVSFAHDGTATTSASFDVLVEDGDEDASAPIAQTFHFAVVAENDPPVAADDALAATEDTPVTYAAADLVGNDDDGDPELNQALTVASVTSGTGGTAVLNGDGTVTFTPAADFNGAADFSYTVSDGLASSAPATVTVNVAAVNDPPVATDDVLSSVAEDSGARIISVASLLGNDSTGPANESGQTLRVAGLFNWVGGTPVFSDDLLNIVFTLDVDFNGAASFDYMVQDNGQTNGANDFMVDIGNVSFAVTPVNDAPVATDDVLSSVAEDSGTRIIGIASLLGNDSTGPANEADQTLTITGLANVVGGSAAIVGSNIEFTPEADFNGAASFDYTVQDNGRSNGADDFKIDTGSVSFDVTPVNDPPVVDDGIDVPGDEFLVNTHTDGFQSQPTIAALAGGGFVVVWSSSGPAGTPVLPGGNGFDIHAQIYDAAGNPVGIEFRVNTITGNPQISPSVAALPDGGFVVTYSAQGHAGDPNYTIQGQRFDATGAAVGAEFRVDQDDDTDNGQQYSTVTALDGGGFLVTWTAPKQDGPGGVIDGSGAAVLGRLYDAAGAPTTDEFLLNTTTAGNQNFSSAAALPGGGFVATWASFNQDGSGDGIFGQRFDAAGAKVGAEFQVNATTANDQQFPSVTALAGGGFVVTWTSFVDFVVGVEVVGRIFDAAGNPAGGDFRVNTSTPASVGDVQNLSSVTALADGGFLVVWQSRLQDSASDFGVFGQRFDATGTKLGDEFQINQTTAGDQGYSGDAGDYTVVQLASGEIVIAWQSGPDSGGFTDVQARIFSPGISATEDTPAVISGVNVSDVDAGANLLLVSLAVDHGSIGLTDLTGLLLVDDDGSDGTFSFTGSQAAINAALASSIVYTPDQNFNGADALTVTADDQGHTGADPGLTGTASSEQGQITIPINVAAVNDAPVLAGDLSATVAEGGATLINTADLNFIDPDDGASEVTFTVSNEVNGTVLVNGAAATSFSGQDLADGLVSFAHDGTETTGASFDVLVEDGNEDASAPVAQTFNLTVFAGNDPPTAADDLFGVSEDAAPAVGDVLANDSDVEDGGPPLAGTVTGFAGAGIGIPAGVIATAYRNGHTYYLQVQTNVGGQPGKWWNTFESEAAALGGHLVTVNDAAENQWLLDTFAAAAIGYANTNLLPDRTAISFFSGFNDAASEGSFVWASGEPVIFANWFAGEPNGGGGSDFGGIFVNFGTAGKWHDILNTTGAVDLPFGIVEVAGLVGANAAANAGQGIVLAGGAILSIAANGQVTLDQNHAYDYLAVGQTLDVQFSYTVQDSGGLTDSADGAVTVTGINDVPTVTVPASAASTNEDTPLELTGARVADPDSGDVLTATIGVSNGALTALGSGAGLTVIDGDGADGDLVIQGSQAAIAAALNSGVRYTPTANYNGADQLVIDVSDNHGTSDTQTVDITVNPVNDAPVLTLPGNNSSIDEDTSVTFANAHVVDPDTGDVITLNLSVAHGSLAPLGALPAGVVVDDGDGSDGTLQVHGSAADIDTMLTNGVSYTPAAHYNGPDTFTVSVHDAANASDSDQVAITVNSVNDPPSGADTTVTTSEDTAYVFQAADFGFTDPNDTPANTFAVVAIASLPAAGTLTRNGIAVTSGQTIPVADIIAGQLAFTPTANANGDAYASFTFQVQDNGGTDNGGSDLDPTPNTITVNVTPVNDAPQAAPVDLGAVTEDGSRLIAAAELLAGVTDIDGPAASITAFTLTSGNGALVDNLDGTWTYTPAANDDSSVTFDYTASDGALAASSTASLDITPVNDAPVVGDDATTVAEGGQVTTGNVLDNDSDPDNTLTAGSIVAFTQGAHGTVVSNGDGTFSYTHDGSETVSDSFTYTIDDGAGGNATATVHITVDPVNDPPDAADDNATVDEGGTVTTPNVLLNDSDVDNALAAGNVVDWSQGARGTVVYNGDGTFNYTHDGSETTSDAFSYTIDDGFGGLDTATVNITVNPVNDAPEVAVAVPGNRVLTNSSPNDPTVSRAVDEAVQLSNLGISGDSAVTVEFWFEYTGATFSMPFGFNQYDFVFLDIFAAPGSERGVGFNTGSGDLYGVVRADLIGGWHHFAAVFDNGNALESKLYIDGVEQTLSQLAGFSNTSFDAISDSARIGGWDLNSQFALDGSIDEVRIWHGERTGAEIVAGMNAVVAGQRPGLVAAYSFENVSDGPGGVTDTSGNGHHGTLSTLTVADNVAIDATVPLDPSVIEDQNLVFSALGNHAITVSDVDSANLTVTLTATSTLTLASTAGLTGLTGDGTSNVTFTGAVADINNALDGLIYTPTANFSGIGHIGYQVFDGTATTNGTIDIQVDPTNDAPEGADNTVTTGEDTPYVFQVADFGFADPVEGDQFLAVKIASLPLAGALLLDGVPVDAGDFVAVADIAAGKLTFAPAPEQSGAGYASFDFQVQDDGGTADGGVDLDPSANTVTIDVTAVNDAPAVAEGNAAASVTEDQSVVASGHFSASDAENDALTWSVVGGVTAGADYFFRIDDLNIVKNGAAFLHDTFGDGLAPPSSPSFANGTATSYFTNGTFFESAGRAVMLGTAAGAGSSVITSVGPVYVHSAILSSNVDPANLTLGLKNDDDFTVEARFDLVMPQDPNEAYGVRLTDRIGDPTPGVHDNDVLGLSVRRSPDAGGQVEVVLQRTDFSADTITIYESYALNPAPGVDQIVLRLSHDNGDVGVVHAEFDLYDHGAFASTQTFANTATIFNGENWTRAEFRAIAPVETVSTQTSDYGTLTVDQDGNWQYVLRNGRPEVQQLGEGDSVIDHFTVQVSDGNGGTTTRNIDVTVNGTNDAPTIAGDLGINVNVGGSVVLTAADFQAVDPDHAANELTFTVTDPTHGHVAFANAPETAITAFTQADLDAGTVVFVHDGFDSGQATFKVSVSDGLANSAATTVIASVPTVTIAVKTAAGMDFETDNTIEAIGSGDVQPDGADQTTKFTIVNAAMNRQFNFQGAGFGYGAGNALIAGTIFAFQELAFDTQTLLAEFTGSVSAQQFYDAAVAEVGTPGAFEAFSSQWRYAFHGGDGNDAFGSSDAQDGFRSSGGSDLFDGGFDYDRANYTSAPGPIDVLLADGTVTKWTDVTKSAVAGTDTLRSIEFVNGTAFADTFNAVGFSASSLNAGSAVTFNTAGTLNEFEGRGGNDVITGNGNTRVSYLHATGPVTVTFTSWVNGQGATGFAVGDASVGTDTFTGVSRVRGSYFDDTFTGSNNPSNTTETFEGRGGDDFINGGGGFDRAVYAFDDSGDGSGVVVNLAAGTVTGGFNTGSDTLRSVEAVSGTEFDDVFDATGFGAASTNAGSLGTLNEFEGGGGNDTITGNGNTRVAFNAATSGVTAVLGAGGDSGTSFGSAQGNLLLGFDPANVGTDTFTGDVARLRGSSSSDNFTGNELNNVLEGQAGNDILNGLGGDDTMTGGTGADRFIYQTGGNDTVTDFDKGEGAFNHDEGDRIDLRPMGISNFTALQALLSESAGNSIVTFSPGNTLTIQGVTNAQLAGRDFQFAGQAGVTVYSPDGYDFSALYDDIAGVDPLLTRHSDTRYVATNPGAGRIFSLVASSASLFTYDGDGNPTGGNVFAVVIYDTDNNILAAVNGFNFALTDFLTAVQNFSGSQDPGELDPFFFTDPNLRYSAIGSRQAATDDGQWGGDTFVASVNNDFFNGLTNANGDISGGDTVDYSHTPGPSGVTVSLAAPAGQQPTGGSGSDALFNIEHLRGSNFDDTLTGDGKDNVLEGGAGDDTLTGGGGNDRLQGGLGNDTLTGGDGLDLGLYTDATGPIAVDMAAGTVSGAGVGSDTIGSIESIRGSAFADTYVATGFAGASAIIGLSAANNTFEGMAGDDIITGNGSTQLSYRHATAGVTVDLAAGTASGDASVGNDGITNVNAVVGSEHADTLLGAAVSEFFSPLAGDDFIDGRGSFDRVIYALRIDDRVTGGVTVNLAAGTVVGDASVGTDTLRSIEGARGTNFADTYDATGFTTTNANGPNFGSAGFTIIGGVQLAFNQFEGMGGDDTIVGNGNTQLVFFNATAGVTVDLLGGTASGDFSVGNDTIAGGVNYLIGSAFGDLLQGFDNPFGVGNTFEGRGGDDTIDGRGGYDVAIYSGDATTASGIDVTVSGGNLAFSVVGDASIGADTLISVESVSGTNFADTYDATGYAGASLDIGQGAGFNEFQGLGGNDEITGNGSTRISYVNASAGVTVDLDAGTAVGNGSVGSDTILGGVASVRGSNFVDTLSGSDNAANTAEHFDGRRGNDAIDGRGGFDRAIYNLDGSTASGIGVTVSGGNLTFTVTGDISIGTDTLTAVESVRGTNFADTFNATGFAGASTDFGLAATFNEFEGMDGDDTITGNGDTRIAFYNAAAAVTVDLDAGQSSGTAAGDVAGVGTDTFTGVNRVRGSEFDDTILGDNGDNILDGRGGNDTLDGRTGNDTLTGGAGADTFRFQSASGQDTVTDFAQGQDHIELAGYFTDQNDPAFQTLLTNMSEAADGVQSIDLGGGNTITLTGVNVNTLNQSDFIVHP